ncbi:MAG: hypothetical protein HRU19_08775 [Pseudobacteriovorax sp.]|nr:hypothetical protein [Pseudobacteriovorax sp.]
MKLSKEQIKKQRGMAATEYIIGLILVAVAAIGTFAIFGNQIKTKVAQASAALSGNTEQYTASQTASDTLAGEGVTRAGTENSMSGANDADMRIGEGGE